jgi:hypothetical protein
MEIPMTKLTPYLVQKIIKGNPKIDQRVDYDEPGKAIIYLNEGWTWEALDGNRSVEGFILSDNDWEDADIVADLKQRIKFIEPVDPECY